MRIKLTSPENFPEFTGGAKRFKDLDYETKKASTNNVSAWTGEEVFVDIGRTPWVYVIDGEWEHEVEPNENN